MSVRQATRRPTPRRPPARASGWPLVAALAVLACQGDDRSAPRDRALAATASPGPLAPALPARTLAGQPISLEDYRGRVVLVNVWATWCEPCRDELPELERLRQAYRARGFEVVGFATDGARQGQRIAQMVESFGLSYPNVHDASGTVMTALEIEGLPTSLLLDRQGRIRWRRAGLLAPDDPELRGLLAVLLDEP